MSNELIEIDDKPQAVVAQPARASGSTPADLVRYAMETGADLDRLERLMKLQVEWQAEEARKAFSEAMAEFSRNPPKVYKDKPVDFKTNSGRTQYKHARIGNATDIIKAALAEHGFSHRWVTTQPQGMVRVECILTHRMGHSQSNFLESPPDSSGGKNGIQAIISARTYLERHTLFDATGCAPLDEEDDDGKGAEPNPAPEDKKPPQKHTLMGPRFDQALQAIRTGQYTAAEMRDYYELTPDQDIALSDLLKELGK